MNPISLISLLLLTASSIVSAEPLPKHWHESKTFGSNTKGGLAGEVYKVTNLKSSGSGSLADAVSKGNRFIVFEVGGIIKGNIVIKASNITIAGETAPKPGISIIQTNFDVLGDHIVVSHITILSGTDAEGYQDASEIKSDYVIYNHVGVYWGKDETLSFHSVHNTSLYKCIIAEGLQFSGHEDGEHSKGTLIKNDNKNFSMIGTLFSHNALRNPRLDKGELFIANGVVYNWAPGWDHRGPKWSKENPKPTKDAFNHVISARGGANITLAGNVALQGPESVGKYLLNGHYYQKNEANGYLKDNIIKDQQGNDLLQVNTDHINVLDKPAIWPDGFEPIPAHEALYEALRTVGSRPGDRDFHNARLIKTIAEGKGELIDSQDEVGGYPDYPKTTHSLTVPSGAQARQDWLDALEDKFAVDRELDLSRLYSLVGSQESDKFRGSTSEVRQLFNQKNNTGISVVQRQSTYKQLRITFSLTTSATVSMKVFDLAGNKVVEQPRKHFKAGTNEVALNVQHLPVGLYVCRVQTGNLIQNISYHCY